MKLFREYVGIGLGIGGGFLAVASIACALIIMAGGGDTSICLLMGGIGASISITGIILMP